MDSFGFSRARPGCFHLLLFRWSRHMRGPRALAVNDGNSSLLSTVTDERRRGGRARCKRYLRVTVCCTELERPTLEGVFLKTLVSRWARSFRLRREESWIREGKPAASAATNQRPLLPASFDFLTTQLRTVLLRLVTIFDFKLRGD